MERKMMKLETPFNPKDEEELCYDPRIDFYQFLDEAKKNGASGENTSFGNRMSKSVVVDHKSKKRSWKNSLFFWRKYHKNKEVLVADSQCGSGGGGGRRRIIKEASLECRKTFAVSGPMTTTMGRRSKDSRVGGGGSGPLAGWFTPTRALETDELPPYRSLLDQQINDPSPSNVKPFFGPIYIVS